MNELTAEMQKKYSSAIKKGFLSVTSPDLHSFCGTWVRKHPGRVSTLVHLRDLLGHIPQWEDMTDDTLSDLKDLLLLYMAPNSVRTICAELKAVLNANKASKPISSTSFKTILRSKKVPSQNVYLTTAELKRLHEYQPVTYQEMYAKEMFMRECLTGARNVDCRRFSMSNIHTVDGVEYLTYVAQKHPVEVSVPVHKWLKCYLHNDWPSAIKNVRTDHLCGTIRKICMDCGIDEETTVYKAGKNMTGPKWQFIATHTGRRTFATLLSLKGCPLEQIALMMGHISGNTPNVNMTAGYICARKKISKTVINLFQ